MARPSGSTRQYDALSPLEREEAVSTSAIGIDEALVGGGLAREYVPKRIAGRTRIVSWAVCVRPARRGNASSNGIGTSAERVGWAFGVAHATVGAGAVSAEGVRPARAVGIEAALVGSVANGGWLWPRHLGDAVARFGAAMGAIAAEQKAAAELARRQEIAGARGLRHAAGCDTHASAAEVVCASARRDDNEAAARGDATGGDVDRGDAARRGIQCAAAARRGLAAGAGVGVSAGIGLPAAGRDYQPKE